MRSGLVDVAGFGATTGPVAFTTGFAAATFAAVAAETSFATMARKLVRRVGEKLVWIAKGTPARRPFGRAPGVPQVR